MVDHTLMKTTILLWVSDQIVCSVLKEKLEREDYTVLDSADRGQAVDRAIVFQPAEPILIADNDRIYRAPSCAGRLFGLPRNRIVGRRFDQFAEAGFRPQIQQLWRAFLQRGEQRGTFRLVGSKRPVREVEYTAKGNAMPERRELAPRDKSKKVPSAAKAIEDPALVKDYALILFEADGRVVGWHS